MYEPLNISKTHQILSRFRPIAPKPPSCHPPHNPPALQLRSRLRKRAKRHKATTFLPLAHRSLHPLVERDLLQTLQQPKIIAPRPVRPIGSCIRVCHVNQLAQFSSSSPLHAKKAEEVECEVESETLPAVVSDCENRVRLANSAYKELVGQPECVWLDFVGCKGFGLRRINGEVAIQFSGESARPESWVNGFSCRAKIEWACDGRKSFVDAPCDVFRVCCESKEYFFTWKFHVGEACGTDCVY